MNKINKNKELYVEITFLLIGLVVVLLVGWIVLKHEVNTVLTYCVNQSNCTLIALQG